MAGQIPKSDVEVILVEDCADDAFFFDRCLEKMGRPFSYLHLKDGAEAKAYLQIPGDRPRLVFLDLKLPKLNGFELLQWLKVQPHWEEVQIVILTGSNNSNEMGVALSAGASEFFIKPLTPEMLNPKLSLWLQRKPSLTTLPIHPANVLSDESGLSQSPN
jgi:DNA-binding response OmpR family regulator